MAFQSIVQETEEEYRALGYYRLSKMDIGRQESDSIANQRKLVHSYLQDKPNIRLVDEAYDDGYTGTNYDRPGFQAVMAAVDEGRVNCVIVKDLSRLGREYIETGKYLEMVFPARGVRFIAINDDVDSEHNNACDDIIIPVKNIMNEAYCRELSKKLRRQFRIQRANGEFLAPFASYGYLKSPDDKHKLVIDDYAAEVVRGIFALKLKGYSQQTIAEHLNRRQVLAPAEYKKSLGLKYKTGFAAKTSGKWTAGTVRGILQNPLYIGPLVQGKRGTPNYKIKQMRVRKEEDWVIVEKNHDPIIDPLAFRAVQQMLERDTRKSPSQDTVFPLSGVLFCADCGRSMSRRTVTRGSKKFSYYVCTTNKRGQGCSSHSFEQSKLELAVLHAIRAQVMLVVEMEQLLEEIGAQSMQGAKEKRIGLMIAQKKTDIDRYQDYRMNLYEALRDELIGQEEYERMRTKYTLLIDESRTAIEEMEKSLQEAQAGVDGDRLWMEQFIKYKDDTELTREMVIALVDRIYVSEDKRIRIEFNFQNEINFCKKIVESAEGEGA